MSKHGLGFDYTPPWSWICRGGAPARCARDMPSYVLEDGNLEVFDFMVPFGFENGMMMLFSRWWGVASAICHDGMVPLHHHEGAWWRWRPAIYTLATSFDLELGYWRALGSQQELSWRYGMMETMHARHFGDEITFDKVRDRADELLLDHLTIQQRLDLAYFGWFRVRGPATNNLYKVEPGNGFAILNPRTLRVEVSYCLHTEGWIPDADQALAVKMALEDEELEVECLENARPVVLDPDRRFTAADVIAQRFERKLIPANRRLVVARA